MEKSEEKQFSAIFFLYENSINNCICWYMSRFCHKHKVCVIIRDREHDLLFGGVILYIETKTAEQAWRLNLISEWMLNTLIFAKVKLKKFIFRKQTYQLNVSLVGMRTLLWDLLMRLKLKSNKAIKIYLRKSFKFMRFTKWIPYVGVTIFLESYQLVNFSSDNASLGDSVMSEISNMRWFVSTLDVSLPIASQILL